MNSGKDLEVTENEGLWQKVCLILLKNPPVFEGIDPSLKRYYRLALFDLTKNQFKSDADLAMMATYYTLAQNKIKDITVAAETKTIIEKLVQEKQDKTLTVTYLNYRMMEQWREGSFKAAI